MDIRKLSFVVAVAVVLVTAAFLVPEGLKTPGTPPLPLGKPLSLASPLGLPPVPMPPGNLPTAETVALGRRLFHDPILSGDHTLSCASCHRPEMHFTDGNSLEIGRGSSPGQYNVPTLLNAVYNTRQFRDGRALTLEDQIQRQIQDPLRLAHTLEGVEERLQSHPDYSRQFERAFGPGPIRHEMVEKALAAYERTLVSANSPFDRWYYGKEQDAVNASAKRGFEVFTNPEKGNCAACHTIGQRYALFTDNRFHNVGSSVDARGEIRDLGRYRVTLEFNDTGAYRTPSLRNVALTAPYMHDGSLKQLKDAIDFYLGGGNSNPYLDERIQPRGNLSGQDRRDLLAFLECLTGEPPNPRVQSETIGALHSQ